jgi:polar amino acid transport system permease protein
MSFFEEFTIVCGALNEGFLQTLKLFIITLLGALPLGLIISFGTMSSFRPLSYVMQTLVWVVRGSPLMIQLLIIYYGPGLLGFYLWSGGEEGRFVAASAAFILNYACYFSEIYRGGIQSVPHGQQEAAQVLGMSKAQTFFRVTLLQMIKRIVPPMSNEIITLVKDTSLARVVTYYELIYFAQRYIKNGGLLWPLFYTAVYYLVFTALLTLLFRWLEKKLDYFKA